MTEDRREQDQSEPLDQSQLLGFSQMPTGILNKPVDQQQSTLGRLFDKVGREVPSPR